MKKETINGRNGYDIPCLSNLDGDEKMVVIFSHGFGSSKESPAAQAVASVLPEYGIGAYIFDFPAHGDSPVNGECLRISNCLNDLSAVETHVHALVPEAEIAYFSSSFGAYINLIYLATRQYLGKKSFLRCAAVTMPELIMNGATPEQHKQLITQGYVTMNSGYSRPLKIVHEFYKDLQEHDVFKLCKPNMAELAMIHGDADEIAPVSETRRFAKQFGAKLTEVKGADHRFTNQGGMEQVISAAIQFFNA